MAQQVKIAGALFDNVPYIRCPDVNDVYHPFMDTSDANATASDIAQGKTAYVNGAKVTGTASGGGGGTPIVAGRIRGDAELVKSWTYDKLIVADEDIAIPAYTTTDTVLKSGAALTTESIDFSSYSYLLLYRSLAMPIYSDSTAASARHIYSAHSNSYIFAYTPTGAFDYDGISAESTGASANYNQINSTYSRTVYYYTKSKIRFLSGSTYGAVMALPSNPSTTMSTTSPYNTGTLNVTAPNLKIRGNTSYLNSTNWAKITDIRYQYIFELWRVPASDSVHGWEVESQFRHILECANGTGTLT